MKRFDWLAWGLAGGLALTVIAFSPAGIRVLALAYDKRLAHV